MAEASNCQLDQVQIAESSKSNIKSQNRCINALVEFTIPSPANSSNSSKNAGRTLQDIDVVQGPF